MIVNKYVLKNNFTGRHPSTPESSTSLSSIIKRTNKQSQRAHLHSHIMQQPTTANNDKNTFFETTMVDGIETPYPPSVPAYCTRSSVKEATDTSKKLTEKELQKLAKNTTKPELQKKSPEIQCVPAITLNPEMHRIMCKYANEQQQLCSQICELNKRLQDKHDENIRLKDEFQEQLKTVKDELSHITEVNYDNEEEISTLEEKNTELCAELTILNTQYTDTQNRYPFYVLAWILLYTFALFYTNHTMNWEMTSHYAILHNTTGIIYEQIRDTCSITDSSPVLHD